LFQIYTTRLYEFLDGLNSSLVHSAGKLWPFMAMGIIYPGSAFVEEFLPSFGFGAIIWATHIKTNQGL